MFIEPVFIISIAGASFFLGYVLAIKDSEQDYDRKQR